MSTSLDRAERDRIEALYREWVDEVCKQSFLNEKGRIGEDKARRGAERLRESLLTRIDEPNGCITWYNNPDARTWERLRNAEKRKT